MDHYEPTWTTRAYEDDVPLVVARIATNAAISFWMLMLSPNDELTVYKINSREVMLTAQFRDDKIRSEDGRLKAAVGNVKKTMLRLGFPADGTAEEPRAAQPQGASIPLPMIVGRLSGLMPQRMRQGRMPLLPQVKRNRNTEDPANEEDLARNSDLVRVLDGTTKLSPEQAQLALTEWNLLVAVEDRNNAINLTVQALRFFHVKASVSCRPWDFFSTLVLSRPLSILLDCLGLLIRRGMT
ncbi:hypothetical protein B9Z65_4103 [Elsinoe australis]|uniref:Uncharacterized protein n=1 Tax=Elsinoe australis TaxID=40998 RepID=A0A2P7Z1U6_9PEZI|nr:hypothetical protein B9Z65_4103 [Elsinoe australis]